MRRLSIAAVVLVLVAAPAWAIREWYEYYRDAQRLMREGKHAEAIASLQQAIRLRPQPGINERTYGLDFIDAYFPYYDMGVCYLRSGDYANALKSFNEEEERGVIRKSGQYRNLQRDRTEADNGARAAEQQKVARLARETVQRLLREASDLLKTRKFEDALGRVTEAQIAAAGLDPATQRQIVELHDRIAAEKKDENDALEARARAQRVEQELADGRRLLDEGTPREASSHFEAALLLDPRSQAAQTGKKEAQERILASTTRQTRQQALAEGKALFDAGKYDDALRPLAEAAADPANGEAQQYLKRTQEVLERFRHQKDLRVKIEQLLTEAEELFTSRKFPEAYVKYDSVLELDPGNVKAKARLGLAQAETGRALFERWLPNETPDLMFFEPRSNDLDGATAAIVEGPTVAVVGIATDDRGIASVEFRVNGELAGAPLTPTRLDPETPVSERRLRFDREFPLAPGPNHITVTAIDGGGLRRVKTFDLTRRLRFYETRAFLPSALATALGLIGAGFAFQRARRRKAVRRRFNPYIAGAPVMDDDMFFGRQKLMTRMLNVLHHNSLMITGERRIGKTTFLYHLKKALETDEGTEYKFFPVLTDLQGVPEATFFHAVMTDVVEALGLAPSTLAALRFRAEEDGYDGRDFSHDLQRVIDELKSRTPRRVKLALLIDEVDVLNEYSERINQRLRSIFMKTFSEHLVAIMSGVGIKRIWNSEVSPWYNFFDEVELSGFTREEAEDLIRRPVEGIFRYEPEAVERILAGSQLKPYVIQKFCIHAVNRMLEEGRTTVTARDVDAVREAVLLEREPELVGDQALA